MFGPLRHNKAFYGRHPSKRSYSNLLLTEEKVRKPGKTRVSLPLDERLRPRQG